MVTKQDELNADWIKWRSRDADIAAGDAARVLQRKPEKGHKVGHYASPGAKVALWKRHDARARSHEPVVLGAARAAFEHDMRELLVMVGEVGKSARQAKATVDWQDLLFKAQQYLAMGGGADANWRELFLPVLEGTMTEAGKSMLAEFDLQFSVPNIGGLKWFDDYMLKFAQPINATTLDSVGTLIQQGVDEGWSVGQMQSHLQEMFGQWMQGGAAGDEFDWYAERMPNYRAEAIARTETIRASNAGTTNLMQEWGIEEHEWLATQDDRVRDDHAEAGGQVVKVGEPFDVGGEGLLYPGDPAGSPGNTINCRCTTIPVIPGLDTSGIDPEDVLGPEEAALRPRARVKYSDDQERDDQGRWVGSGGGGTVGRGETVTFHATLASRVDSIVKKGLVPKDPNSGVFRSALRGTNQPVGVYFTGTLREAKEWAEQVASNTGKDEIAILTIRVSDKYVEEDEHGDAQYSTKPIAPDDILGARYYINEGGMFPGFIELKPDKAVSGELHVVVFMVMEDKQKSLPRRKARDGRGPFGALGI